MSARNDVAPDTLGVELTEDGIAVEYNDSRTVFYHGVPKKADGKLRTAPAKDAHGTVTDASETQGILVYVNDLNTHDDILEDTGVGRIMLDDGRRTNCSPASSCATTRCASKSKRTWTRWTGASSSSKRTRWANRATDRFSGVLIRERARASERCFWSRFLPERVRERRERTRRKKGGRGRTR